MVNLRRVISGDLHIRLEQLELSRQVLQHLKVLALQFKCPIMILGDLFHTKAIIRSECLNMVLEEINSNPDVIWEILIGNHDYENRNCQGHSLEALKMLKNVVIYHEPLLDDELYSVIPFRSDEEFSKLLKKCKAPYLFCHQGIEGFMMNNHKPDSESLKKKEFKKFKMVLSGHYHVPQQKDNIVYVGSPYQQDFGECTQTKRFILFEDGKVTDIPTDEFEFPKYHVIQRTVSQVLDPNDGVYGIRLQDHVRFDLKGSKDEILKITKTLLRDKYKLGSDVRVKPLYEEREGEVTIQDSLDYPKMFERWLSSQNTQLDKQRLLKEGVEYISANL